MGDEAKLKQKETMVFFFWEKWWPPRPNREQYLLTVSSIVFGLEGNNQWQAGELPII